MTDSADHVLLVGGGHAHVAVLADWERQGLPARRATLLTPHRYLRYSGMIPGLISGRYRDDEGVIDLFALAGSAGARIEQGRCVAIDPEGRAVTTEQGERIAFSLASLDTGGVGRARRLLGDDTRLADVRPIERFVEKIEQTLRNAQGRSHVVVIGGGAGGVEIAFALRNCARCSQSPEVQLVTGSEGLLPGFGIWTRRLVRIELVRQGIAVICKDASLEGGALHAGGRPLEPVDLAVAALGSDAPDWPAEGGLACDSQGFLLVDPNQRSISHPHVFATGDMARRVDRGVPPSGVHAVHAGPVLAQNLRAVGEGREPTRIYRPRPASLYLISTGDGSAIASYGPLAAQGRWLGALKHRIDTGWIAQYTRNGTGGS